MTPGSDILKHVSAREASVAVHISIVVAVRANGLPLGQPIFIVAGTKLPEGLASDSDDYYFVLSPGGGQTSETWEACCNYWTRILEGGEILVVDGHGSHKDFVAIEALVAKGISLCTLVPNVSEVDQVRDGLRAYAALRASWATAPVALAQYGIGACDAWVQGRQGVG